VSETSVYWNYLTRLSAPEDFIKYCGREKLQKPVIYSIKTVLGQRTASRCEGSPTSVPIFRVLPMDWLSPKLTTVINIYAVHQDTQSVLMSEFIQHLC
jgi:hypothetical protein